MDEIDKMGVENPEALKSIFGQVTSERPDSISLSKTSTGKYSWTIKMRSGDLSEKENQEKLLQEIERIHLKLRKRFGR